jgi:type I site-specific restriction endonuclease
LREFLLADSPSKTGEEQGSEVPLANREYIDYGMSDRNGRPWAIVAAKRTSREALGEKRQAADYADRTCAAHHFEPFIFLKNGKKIFFWDREQYSVREISGFLQKMIWRVSPFSVNIEKI